mmetsp:Transcript_130181/g.376638  ORF Transcript_130181/g.376638 Transcript_130181/m.376638 type:complete len:218 (+) Transcript_130181:85-738(+)
MPGGAPGLSRDRAHVPARNEGRRSAASVALVLGSQLLLARNLGREPLVPRFLVAVVLHEVLPRVPCAVLCLPLLGPRLKPLADPTLLAQGVDVVIAEVEDGVGLAVLGHAALHHLLGAGPLLLALRIVVFLELLGVVQLPVVRPPHLDSLWVAMHPAPLDAELATRVHGAAPRGVLLRAPMEVVAAVAMRARLAPATATEHILAVLALHHLRRVSCT